MKTKTLVLGLDGATFTLIKPWIQQGFLPNFKFLLEKGAHGILKSTIPAATCPAWPAFYTGKNPGKFGVYYFENFKSNSYNTFFADYSSIKSESIWDILGKYNKTSAISNIPVTYPAKKINGIMISGSAIHPDKSIYPLEFKEQLPSDYIYSMPPVHSVGKQEYINLNFKSIQQQFNLIQNFLDKDYDFVCSVFRITDFFAHRFWKHMHNKDPEFKDTILKAYQESDAYIGKLIKRKDINLIIMSDHGNTLLKKTFFINDWLIKHNYLTLKKQKQSMLKKTGINKDNLYSLLTSLKLSWITRFIPKSIKHTIPNKLSESIDLNNIDWSKTKVIAKSASDIYINLKDQRPEGIVSKEEYPRLIKEIEEKLKNLKDNEKELDIKLFKKQLYKGPYQDLAADFFILIENGSYRTASSINNNEILQADASPNSTSNHTPDGIFIAYGPDIKNTEIQDANILDLAPTILYLNKIPIPKDMDGKPLTQIFNKEFLPEEKKQQEQKTQKQESLSEKDEEIIKQRLKSLGYLD